jgi:hypothetical protein
MFFRILMLIFGLYKRREKYYPEADFRGKFFFFKILFSIISIWIYNFLFGRIPFILRKSGPLLNPYYNFRYIYLSILEIKKRFNKMASMLLSAENKKFYNLINSKKENCTMDAFGVQSISEKILFFLCIFIIFSFNKFSNHSKFTL